MTGSSSDSVTAFEARIIKKIEYYFNDVNLLKNKFIKKKIQEDDGWVTMDTMLRFNRFKEISDNAQIICEVLKKSSSGLMEVSEQGDKIRRSPSKPLPVDTKETRKEIIARTVFAKPFPLDVKLDDLLEFFEGYGKVDNVFMKNHFLMKTFKGCVFVTFANKEGAAKFVNEEETKFKEQDLEEKCFKTDYSKHKNRAKEQETEAGPEERVCQKMTKNANLNLRGLNHMTSIRQVMAYISSVLQSDVARVDIVKDATDGYIRLREPDSACSTLEKAKTVNDGKVVIQDSETEVRVVEGGEELQYWKKLINNVADKKKSGLRGRRKDGRKYRGGRNQREEPQGKRKHNKNEDTYGGGTDGAEQDTEEPPAKVTKFDEVITCAQGKQRRKKRNKPPEDRLAWLFSMIE